jgi:aspartate/methionine/tyrosine aminotransferase
MEVARAAEARAAAGADVLHLEVGQPSTPAPAGVRAAAARALETMTLGYTLATGYEPLRHRIAEHYDAWYGLAVDPQQIIVTDGASGACVLAFLACFDEGDRVGVPAPGYPCYRNMLQAFGVEVVDLVVDHTTRFQPTPGLLAAAGPLDGVVVASPSNPTGTMLDHGELARLAAWCRANDVRLISDEIYHGITFGEPASTAAAHPDAVVVNSFSKYFSMTGWRLGWLVLPPELVSCTERLGANLFIAAPTLSQVAAVAAFDCHPELQANVERYRANRAVLLEGLPAAGLDRLAPADGAFYVYADVAHLTDDSQELSAQWLAELNLATTPGIDFDPVNGRTAVRFSFAGSTDDMLRAVDRLVASRRPVTRPHP